MHKERKAVINILEKRMLTNLPPNLSFWKALKKPKLIFSCGLCCLLWERRRAPEVRKATLVAVQGWELEFHGCNSPRNHISWFLPFLWFTYFYSARSTVTFLSGPLPQFSGRRVNRFNKSLSLLHKLSDSFCVHFTWLSALALTWKLAQHFSEATSTSAGSILLHVV